MMKAGWKKKILISGWLALLVMSLIAAVPVQAATEKVVSLGKDLNAAQRQQMLDLFGVKEEEVTLIEVTNQEEREYLGGLIDDALIGTRAISSAYIEMAPQGHGIEVTTHRITWVSEAMYTNALITAGVEDAIVKVAAPFDVSGTAGLTGIIKAFEAATDKSLDQERIQVANEEMVTQAEIGERIGNQELAAELMARLKEEIAKQNFTDEQLRQMILQVASELGITLSEEEISSLISILKKLQNLNIDWDKVSRQLTQIKDQFTQYLEQNPEAKNFFVRLLQAIQVWIQNLLASLRG